MTYRFRSGANMFMRAGLLAVPALLGGGASGAWLLSRSSYATGVGVEVSQLVPFSHEHHVSGLVRESITSRSLDDIVSIAGTGAPALLTLRPQCRIGFQGLLEQRSSGVL